MTVRHSMIWMLGGNGVMFVIQMAGIVVISRILTPYETGIFALALGVMAVANTVQSLGFSTFLIRDPLLNRERIGTVFGLLLIQGLAIGSLLFAAAPVAGWLFDDAAVAKLVRCLAGVPLLSALEGLPSGLMQRQMNFRLIAGANIARAATAAAVTILCALAGYSFMSFGFGALAGGLAALLTLSLLARNAEWARPNLVHWREVVAFGVPLLQTSGVVTAATRAPDFILGATLGATIVGYYSRASSTLNLFYTNVVAPINNVAAPRLSQQVRDAQDIRTPVKQLFALNIGLFGPPLAGLAVLSAPVVTLVFGDKWLPVADVLTVMCLVGIVGLPQAGLYPILVARDALSLQPRIELLRALVMVPCFLVGASFGMTTAAASRLADEITVMAKWAPHLVRLTGIPLVEFGRIILISLPLIVAAPAASFAYMQIKGWPSSIPTLHLTGLIVTGIFSWTVAAIWTGHPLGEEIKRVARATIIRAGWGDAQRSNKNS